MLLLGEEIQLTPWDCYTETVRELLYFPLLFQFVYTVFLTDYFILMVVLMVHAFLLPCKRVYLYSSSPRPEIWYTNRMAGIWEDCELQYIRWDWKFRPEISFWEKFWVQKKNPRTTLKRGKKLNRVWRTTSSLNCLKKIRVWWKKNKTQNIQGENGILMLRKHDKI